MEVGIESINAYVGKAFIDVRTLFEARGLDLERFPNLQMYRKSVGLPCEDPVTNAVNAAKPIIEALSADERDRIELVITSTESSLDFGKALSTYVHDYLKLSRNCRLFEVKQACYAGTAALHMASSYVQASPYPGTKALVIATDTARAAAKGTYAEPTQGVGAVAMLVSQNPEVMALDFGANGLYSYEVMDTCRPTAEIETGDPDLSLLSYLDCLENSFANYQAKIEGADFLTTFDFLSFHTPFAGMVIGAHRKMMRKHAKLSAKEIELDFKRRMYPSLKYCIQVGNVYSATLYLALCGLIESGEFNGDKRVGLFSYGSGCSSEFYSGVISPRSKRKIQKMSLDRSIEDRCELSMARYDDMLSQNMEWLFGVQDKKVNLANFSEIYGKYYEGKGLLRLSEVKDYHRVYSWS
jgi:polyketide biosynthesis 3-hydroxy-3-methylglutaryl-CoA synthase-like enzyme PksG